MSKFRLIQMAIMLILILALGSLPSCGAFAGGGNVAIPPFNSYYSVAVGDLNGDGTLDIVTCYSKIADPPPHPGVVAIYSQDAASPGPQHHVRNHGRNNNSPATPPLPAVVLRPA
jgi:hypothetical protein